MSADPLLTVEGLTMVFGGLVANQDVSFSVRSGEIVGLIGPNGAGKTTLFNCLAGVEKPTAGRIVLDGGEITGFKPEAVAALGLARTFQIVRVFPTMTVLENVMVGAMLRTRRVARARARAEEELAFVGLSDRRRGHRRDLDHRGAEALGGGARARHRAEADSAGRDHGRPHPDRGRRRRLAGASASDGAV